MSDAPERIWMFAANLQKYLPGGGKIMMGDTQYTREDIVDARVHAAHRAGYEAARADAAKSGCHLLDYDVFMGEAKP